MSWFLIGWKKTRYDFRKTPFLTLTRHRQSYNIKPDHPPQRVKWMFLSYFVAIPLVIAAHINLLLQKGGMPEKRRQEFIPYEHLRIRHKRFPWGDGDKSFFHSPYWNALPSGYEPDSDIYEKRKNETRGPCKEKNPDDGDGDDGGEEGKKE